MLSSTVAIKPSVLVLLSLWTIVPALVKAADPTTTAPAAAINTFVPSCAQGCFQAFLENNRFLDGCGVSPSLQCLCTRYGSTGAAFGEGAVQCMAAERNVGRCQADQVQSAAVNGAYSICHTIPNFASPTQKTIVATTIIQTRTFTPSTSSVRTSSTTSASTDTPTTLITAPKTTPSPESSQTLTNTNPPVPNASAKPSSGPERTTTSAKLNGGQVAGITIGAVAGLFLLVAVAFFARRARKNHLENGIDASRPSYLGPGGGGGGRPGGGVGGTFARLRDSWSRGGSKQSQTSSRPQSMQISGPMNVGGVSGDPWARPYESIAPGVRPVPVETSRDLGGPIGMALSPENKAEAGRFPPGGPQVTAAAVPGRRRSLQYTPPQHGQQFSRQRTGSPAEGKPALTLAIPPSRDSDVTEFAEDGEDDEAIAGGAQIWRPPANDPQSATTYYVADKWGNWRRKSTIKGQRPDGTENRSAPVGESQSATVAPLKVPGRLGSPIDISKNAGQKDELSASSSVYSPFSPPQSIHPDANNPMPPFPKSAYAKMLAMNNENSGHPAAVAKLPGGVIGVGGAMASRDPDQSTANNAGDARARDRNSPVSPGVSPVAYPAIPRRDARRGQQQQQGERQSPRNAVHNMLFPPRDLGLSPPGQPSPTLGAAVPVRSASAGQTGGPQQPAQAVGRSLTGGMRATPGSRAVGADYGNPYSDGPARQSPAPDYGNPYRDAANPYSDSNDNGNTGSSRPPPASPDSFNTVGSALLAKRLGAEKAAALNLAGADEGEFTGARSGWKRQPGEAGTVDVPGLGRVPLPSTPGWEPKLTPTRRGDDLFLKVG